MGSPGNSHLPFVEGVSFPSDFKGERGSLDPRRVPGFKYVDGDTDVENALVCLTQLPLCTQKSDQEMRIEADREVFANFGEVSVDC